MSKFNFDRLIYQVSLLDKMSILLSTSNFMLIDDGNAAYVIEVKDKKPHSLHINRELGR